MARLSDLKLKYRLYMQVYPYRHLDWRPGAHLRKPLSESKVAAVTSAAFYGEGQEPFDPKIKGGEYFYREIPEDVELGTLKIGHKSDAFDHPGIERTKISRFRWTGCVNSKTEELIGSLSERHFSLMGSITAPARLISISAPEIAQKLAEDAVDVVLLTTF